MDTSTIQTVTKERFESDTYLIRQGIQGIIIKNHYKDEFRPNKQFANDVKQIEETLQQKKGKIFKIIDESKETISRRLNERTESYKRGGIPDVLMVFVLGFGESQDMFYTDSSSEERMDIQCIIDKFMPSKCPELILRPKLFFIQIDGQKEERIKGDYNDKSVGALVLETVPTDIDLFIYTSSVGYNKSGFMDKSGTHDEQTDKRETSDEPMDESGTVYDQTDKSKHPDEPKSHFISSIMSALRNSGDDGVDINDIVIKTNKEMSDKIGSVPTCTNQLIRDLYL